MRDRVVVQPNADLDFASTVGLNLLSGRVCAPPPPTDGLVSPSFSVPRPLFETMGRIKVPEACRAVVFGQGETIYDIGPGVHNLNFCTPGPLFGRLVDASLRRLTDRLSGLRTADLAEVTVEVQLQYQVEDAVAVVEMKEPVATLRTVLVGAVREQIQRVPHAALFGNSPGTDVMAGARLERNVRQALQRNETLEVFRVRAVQVTPVAGDSRYLDMAARIEIARQDLAARATELQAQQMLLDRERLLAVTRAEAERDRRRIEEQTGVDVAQLRQQVFSNELPARTFEMEQEQRRMNNELERVRFESLAQALQAFAAPYALGATANAPFTYGGNSAARDEALSHLVDRLTGTAAGTGASGTRGGNGSATQ